MIIDMHSHILPGIDDGAKDMEETKKMLQIAVSEGISGIVATPHCEVEQAVGYRRRYEEAYRKTKAYIEENDIPIRLFRGNEIFYSVDAVKYLRRENFHTLNDTKYVLVEFPAYVEYVYIEKALRDLLVSGYYPIIAHVERYLELRDIKKLENLVEMGAYIQVNTGSILGKDGWKTKCFCLKLLKKRLVHVIGTDSHGAGHRRPQMRMCRHYLREKVGMYYSHTLISRNPKKIIEGEKICGKNYIE